jgi:CHAD domain-containing protein
MAEKKHSGSRRRTPESKASEKRKSPKKPRLELRREASFGKGLRQLAELQLDAAMQELKGNNVSPAAVHNARTYIKKVRAIIQLASPSMDRPLREKLLGLLRDASARTGPLRDSEVQVGTFDLLMKQGGFAAGEFSSLKNGLADVANQRRLNDARQIPRVVRALASVRDSLAECPLDTLDSKNLHRRILRTYRRGRTALDLSATTRDADDFHLWRKLVKQLWYQLRITAPYWEGNGGELIAETGRIGELAGTERDYTMLGASLSAGPKTKGSALLQECISRVLPKLRKEATDAGERFYEPRPKAFMRALDL